MTDLRISPLVVSALFETSERARNLALRLDAFSHSKPDPSDGKVLRDELKDTRDTLEYARAQLQDLAAAVQASAAG